MDVAKYRSLFLEEAGEHLGEMSSALLALEKDSSDGEAIDLVFRMAHSIKGMAGSLGYDAVTEVAHRLEDRMHGVRSAGCVSGPEEMALLFRGLDGLSRMVAVVEQTGEAPPPDAELVAALEQPAAAGPAVAGPGPDAAVSQPGAPPKKG